jgi:hypothetical protein
MMQYVSATLSIVTALVLAAIVLPHAVREGLILKAGMVTMIFGLLAGAGIKLSGIEAPLNAWRAELTLHMGIAIVCAGLVVRAHKIGRRRRARGEGWHAQRTSQLLYQITEPVRDLALLFEDEPRQVERSHK